MQPPKPGLSDAMHGAFGIPVWLTGLVVAVALAAVILGGVKPIGKTTSLLVPTMVIFYLLACTWVLIAHADRVPAAFAAIFTEAFTGSSAAGGSISSSTRKPWYG